MSWLDSVAANVREMRDTKDSRLSAAIGIYVEAA